VLRAGKSGKAAAFDATAFAATASLSVAIIFLEAAPQD
jgi:hypothetical protein